MKSENLIKVFPLFFGDDDLRPFFKTGQKQDGFFYATDAHALIRVPDTYDLPYTVNEKAPHFYRVVPPPVEKIEIDIKELHSKIDAVTPKVIATKPCDACDGNGYNECDLGHEHECELCNDGEIEIVPRRKVFDKYTEYKFHRTRCSRLQLMKMITACEMLGIEKVYKVHGAENRAACYVADDVLFLVMPVSEKDGDCHEINLTGGSLTPLPQ